jgi:[amino group carrier protein]-lysine/ornithine hydrolase
MTAPEVELLYRMVQIPSPSGNEAELAGFLAEAAARLGMRATVDGVGNVVAVTGSGRGPTVLLLSHLDTVDDPIPVRLCADRVSGRGAVDAKGPLAAMVYAAAGRPDFPGRLVVAAVVEEEVPGSSGAMHLRGTLPRPDAVLIGEPSGWSSVVLGYKGILDLRYRVRRPATHPTNPMEKATEAAAAFWADAVAAIGPDASHTAFNQPAVTLNRMAGDMAEASLQLSYRLPPGFDSAGLVERLRTLARGGDVEVCGMVPAVRTGSRDPVVRALTAGIRAAGGVPRHKLKTATSDMNIMAEAWDAPTAAYGPGDSALDHSDAEYLLIEDYLRGIRVLRRALDELAQLPAPYPPCAVSGE